MTTRNLPGGKGRLARKADNLTTICEPIVQEMWEPGPPVTGIALPFSFYSIISVYVEAKGIDFIVV
jgi:hypothetical protein